MRVRFLTLLVLLSFFETSFSQSKKRKKRDREKKEATDYNQVLSIHESDLIHNDFMYFKNINIIEEYYNEKHLNHIRQLDEKKHWKQLYIELKKYVRNFGIKNFYNDTKLIWRLAKLTEHFGTHHEAKSLYRLALRHHTEGIDIREVELYYDTLNDQEISHFVPLEYYYELVEHRKLIDTLRPPRGVLLNMGSNINSPDADYGPALNENNSVFLFTSKRHKTQDLLKERENENLFYSKRNLETGEWSDARSIKEFNTMYNEGSPCISNDGKSLVFSRCNCRDCFGNCDLFISYLQEDSIWSKPQSMGNNVNSVNWDSHPSFSHHGDTLYFSSDRLGGFGMADIYFTYQGKDGEWKPAKNLGPFINSRKNDVSPFYHPHINMLYFSSDGQMYNFGDFDIYKSFRVGNNWSEPINIGPLVNGKGSEFYFTIDSYSQFLFYARSVTDDINKQDLYSYPLPMGAKPGANIHVSGSLVDEYGNPLGGIVSVVDLDEGVEIAPKYLDDGKFDFDLINHRDYLLILQGDDFFRMEEIFHLEGSLTLDKVTHTISSRVKFESIEFDPGKANLKPEMFADLNKIINFMYDNIDFKLEISGHTDLTGNPEKNLNLSKTRAENIHSYIVDFGGITENRVKYGGYGSSQPIIKKELTDDDREVNRRVEFRIYREDGEEK